ncbi:lipocalin-like domain-containing protein [Paenibacillus apii]|uniref:lipocalin-like domain-containing protein n=1 Tax=Paenibacillus apii TaxID=1850370 RepID=UPI0039A783EE
MGNYLAYAGTFELKEDRLIHHINVSNVQDWIGASQVRLFTLEGDYLTLSTLPMPAEGNARGILRGKKLNRSKYSVLNAPTAPLH